MQSQFVAARNRVSVDDGDHRKGIMLHRVQNGLDRAFRVQCPCPLAEVHSGAKDRPLRAQHGQPLSPVRLTPERIEQGVEHLAVERVALFRAVQPHGAHRALAFDRDNRHRFLELSFFRRESLARARALSNHARLGDRFRDAA